MACKKCGVGTYSTAKGASSPTECNKCAAGKKNPNNGSFSSDDCTDCAAMTKSESLTGRSRFLAFRIESGWVEIRRMSLLRCGHSKAREGGAIRVSGDGHVLLKKVRHNTLYHLWQHGQFLL